jgi:hypothetical protein
MPWIARIHAAGLLKQVLSHNDLVLTRRLLLLISVLLVVAAMASALQTAEPTRTQGGATTPGPARIDTGNAGAREVQVRLPSDRPVLARLGDLVSVRVQASQPDVVEVRGLGITHEVGPLEDDPIQFVPGATGRFPVILQGTGTRIGTLLVSAPR